jgi:hypothetical protein
MRSGMEGEVPCQWQGWDEVTEEPACTLNAFFLQYNPKRWIVFKCWQLPQVSPCAPYSPSILKSSSNSCLDLSRLELCGWLCTAGSSPEETHLGSCSRDCGRDPHRFPISILPFYNIRTEAEPTASWTALHFPASLAAKFINRRGAQSPWKSTMQ